MEVIRERFLKNYITDEQLEQFFKLKVITQEECKSIYLEKYPDEADYFLK